MAIGASQGNVIASAFVRIQPETSGFGPALRQTLATNLLQLEKQSDSHLRKLQQSIGTATKLFVSAGVTSLSLFSAAALKSATDLEKTSNAFKGLFGSVAEGRKQFDAVFQLAEVTPFEGAGLAKNFQKFVAAYTAGGLEIKDASAKTMNILETLADGGSALGATSEKIDGFSLALTQMVGKGKLTGEEIRQMTNNLDGFNIRGAVATELYGNSLPESISKLDKAMKKGEVTADDAMAGILAGLKKIPGAAGAAERQLRTVSGAMSTLKDIFQRSTFDGLEDDLKVVSNTIVDNAEIFRGVFREMSEELGGIVVTMTGIFANTLQDFDESFGKFAIGGMKVASSVLYGFGEGLQESFTYLGTLGQMLQDNQGYFIQFGQSLGNLSAGFASFYTKIVQGFEPVFKVATNFFLLFSEGFKSVALVGGSQIRTAFQEVGFGIMGVYNNLIESFRRVFDPAVMTDFVKGIFGVARALVELLVPPLDAISNKTTDLANGFEHIFDSITPQLENLKASLGNLGESFGDLFSKIDTTLLTDFIANVGRNFVESFAALAQFGALAVDTMTLLLNVVQPLAGVFNSLGAQAASAFLVFKVTKSPILTMISLFKDFDTGMVVFVITLTKAVPIIRQFQASLAAFKTTNIASNLAGISLGFRHLAGSVAGLGAVAPQSAAQYIQSMVGVDKFSQTAANSITKAMGPMAKLPIASYEAQRGMLDFAGTVPAANRNLNVLTKGLVSSGIAAKSVGVDFTSAKSTMKSMGSSALGAADDIHVARKAYVSYGKESSSASVKAAANGAQVSKSMQNAAVQTEGATAKASRLSGALGGIGGMAAALGLGIGISLFTAHLAKAAEQANRTREAIAGFRDLGVDFLNSKGGSERAEVISSVKDSIAESFKDDAKALGEFNTLLYKSGYDQAEFIDRIYTDEASRKATLGNVVSNFVDSVGDKRFIEFDSRTKRAAGEKPGEDVQDQYGKFLIELAKNGGNIERGLDYNDRGVQDTIAKLNGISTKELKNSKGSQREEYFKKANVDQVFDVYNKSRGTTQLVGEYADFVKVLGQVAEGSVDAGYKFKQQQKELKSLDDQAKDALTTFKAYGEAQRNALTSSSTFFDLQFETTNAEFIAAQTKNANIAKQGDFSSKSLLGTREGTEFLETFTRFSEGDNNIKKNLNAPISQTIDLLKKSNLEIQTFGDAVGLSAEQIKQVQVATGDLSYAEDLGDFVHQLQQADELGGAKLDAILREAIIMSPEDQKAFLNSIPDEATKNLLEKGLKDLEGNVLLKVDPQIFSDLSTAISNAGSAKIDLDFINDGISVRGFAVREAIQGLIDAVIPGLDALNQKFADGKINTKEYADGITKTRGEVIQTLRDEGVALKDALDIYEELGLVNEIARVRTLIDNQSPEEAAKTRDAYFNKFTEKEFKLKIKAEMELEPGRAVEDFIAKAEGADKSNTKYAFKGFDPKDLATLSLNESSSFIKMNVIPEVEPSVRAQFIADIATLNPALAIDLLPKLSKEEVADVLKIIPPDQAVSIVTDMEPAALRDALLLIPKEKATAIITEMNPSALSRVLAQLPKEQQTDIITLLPPTEQEKIKAMIRSWELSAGVTVTAKNGISFPSTTASVVFNKNAQGQTTGITTNAFSIAPVSFTNPAFAAADGTILYKATNLLAGEAGAEAIIPMTRPKRALQLLKQSGLYDLALTHAKSGASSNTVPYSTGMSTDNSQKIEVNVDMRNTKTTDPEGMALLLASRLTNGIRR